MEFDLHSEPAPAGLDALGDAVELREVPYGEMRAAMRAGNADESPERLLGVCLHVDGEPLTYEGLLALPGRFAGAISKALERALRMHGMLRDEGDDAPKA